MRRGCCTALITQDEDRAFGPAFESCIIIRYLSNNEAHLSLRAHPRFPTSLNLHLSVSILAWNAIHMHKLEFEAYEQMGSNRRMSRAPGQVFRKGLPMAQGEDRQTFKKSNSTINMTMFHKCITYLWYLAHFIKAWSKYCNFSIFVYKQKSEIPNFTCLKKKA